MLIKVRGSFAGIKEYLEKGRKEGREFSRDELDERVILEGDLETTDAVIAAMGGSGEKYLHITMSFREDEISRETLQAITQDFKAFAFAAYQDGEFNLYAEAHLPRIKSYFHRRDPDKRLERKPHIHIVIPECNLIAGTVLNPFGRVEQNIKFVDAFQEHINAKYGLASPKDHRRADFNDASEMLSRYKGDVFSGANAELKNRIVAEVLERGIQDYEKFKALLAELGQTKTRNAGKAGEYLNVKPAGADKGVNLKEFVFSREFIELDDQAKRAKLAAEAGDGYQVAGPARPSEREIEATLQEWHQVRAREIKYLNSGNRKAYAAYRAATPEQRRAILAEREARFYAKHREELPTHEQRTQGLGRDPYDRTYPFKRGRGHQRGQPDLAADRGIEAPESLNRVRSLSSFGVDGHAEGRQVLLPGDARDHVGDARPEHADPLRRPADRAGDAGLTSTGRDVDNVVGQLGADARERKAQAMGEQQPDMATIKRTLDARLLLAQLSQSHGLQPDRFTITKGKDGGDRIQCGARNLNVSDFLTKEMNLPWKDAALILREVGAQQLAKQRTPVRSNPRRELWQLFRDVGRAQQDQRRADEWAKQRARDAERRTAAKADFLGRRGRIEGDRALTAAERKAAISVARMERLQVEQALRDRIKAEHAELRAKHRKPYAEAYRDFLTTLAQDGNADALEELRRQRKEPEHEAEGPTIMPAQASGKKRSLLMPHPLTYTVERNGDVTYHDATGRAVLQDASREVRMFQLDDAAIETGLRLAAQKFGQRLTLNGDAAFQRRAVEIAVANGLKVQFTDPSLERYRAELEQAKRPSRAQPAQPRAPEPTAAPATAQASEVPQPAPAPSAEPELQASTPAPAARSAQPLVDAQRELGREVLQVEPGRLYVGNIINITPDGFAVQRLDRAGKLVVIHDVRQLDGRYAEDQLAEIRYTDGRGVDLRQAIQKDKGIDR